MSKKKSNQILIAALVLVLLVFAIVTVIASKAAYNKKVAGENITEPDFYSMTEFCRENSEAVMKALKSGNADKLGALMINSKGAEDVTAFADWSKADFDNAVSLGAGSLSEAPDKKGMMDIAERFIVPVGEQKYILYVESLTSRHGMNNEGISAVGATTYEHFDELNYHWNGKKDDKSVLAGDLYVKE